MYLHAYRFNINIHILIHPCANIKSTQIYYFVMDVLLCLFQDGGSLDLILKKAGRLPEPILGKICVAVRVYFMWSWLIIMTCYKQCFVSDQ